MLQSVRKRFLGVFFSAYPATKRAIIRFYSPTAFVRAYQAVKEDDLQVYHATREYAVPLATLKDRIDNRISIEHGIH